MSIYDKLSALNIRLPEAVAPAAAFVPTVRVGDLVFVSGHIARQGGKSWAAKLGRDMTTEEGKAAARSVAVDLLATLHAALGDLERIERIVKLMVLVNSAPGFIEQHLVANGASELLVELFGPRGAHTRAAFGAAELPLGSCVEIELVAQISTAVEPG